MRSFYHYDVRSTYWSSVLILLLNHGFLKKQITIVARVFPQLAKDSVKVLLIT